MADPTAAAEPAPSLFISYASQDRPAARLLRDALLAAGFEVWYDENELGGGDAWDQKIRRQIRECTYFMPVVSATTEARHEGYFRREWRLAVERTLDMADDVTFLVPVVIDGTPQTRARVPEKFHTVQWLLVPGGEPTPAFQAWARSLRAGRSTLPEPSTRSTATGARRAPPPVEPAAEVPPPVIVPPFPEQRPGHTLHFLFCVIGWSFQWLWARYRGMRKGWRRAIVTLLVIGLMERMCSAPKTPVTHEAHISAGDEIDAKRGAEIAARIARELRVKLPKIAAPEVLAFPFVTPEGDTVAKPFAAAVFAKLAAAFPPSESKGFGIAKEAVSGPGAVNLARAQHADKVLDGEVTGAAGEQVLQVRLFDVDDYTEIWTKRYPLKTSDPATVALELTQAVKSETGD